MRNVPRAARSCSKDRILRSLHVSGDEPTITLHSSTSTLEPSSAICRSMSRRHAPSRVGASAARLVARAGQRLQLRVGGVQRSPLGATRESAGAAAWPPTSVLYLIPRTAKYMKEGYPRAARAHTHPARAQLPSTRAARRCSVAPPRCRQHASMSGPVSTRRRSWTGAAGPATTRRSGDSATSLRRCAPPRAGHLTAVPSLPHCP